MSMPPPRPPRPPPVPVVIESPVEDSTSSSGAGWFSSTTSTTPSGTMSIISYTCLEGDTSVASMSTAPSTSTAATKAFTLEVESSEIRISSSLFGKDGLPGGNDNRGSCSSSNSPKKNPVMEGKSLLGADLAMPPPTSTKVKKCRNLVKPGKSMVQWMKLQETREQVPTRRKIPLSEIAKHNTESDCWMVIRNFVYDVTEYLPYHPGGIPELMKGAGKDATSLFNEVHRWVNFDSILRTCLLGYLHAESFEEIAGTNTEVDQKSIVPAMSMGTQTSGNDSLPSTKFSENDKLLIFQVETVKQGDDDELSEDNWCVSILNRERFLLKVILKPPDLWMAHVKLLQSLSDDSLAVSFQNSFRKAVITFKKPSIGSWNKLGLPLENNNRLFDSREAQMMDEFCEAKIVEKEKLTKDVFLFGIQPVSSSVLGVPAGFHLKIRPHHEDGPVRKYTPVSKTLSIEYNSNSKGTTNSSDRVLYFIIKIYPDGQLTKIIGSLDINSSVEMGSVSGRYNHSFMSNCDTLVSFAGGTGITPSVKIVNFLRQHTETYPVSRILLIFFNHTEEDIIWRDQWTKLDTAWKPFHFFPIVSRPSDTWRGLTGRVNDVSLFKTVLEEALKKEKGALPAKLGSEIGKFKTIICGSLGFNDACVTMLKSQTFTEISVTDEDMFIF